MARPKKQINRREDILDAAEKLFAEKGFEKTTVDDIAKYIGIGKGSVYLDFKNKDEIHLALVEKQAGLMLRDIESKIEIAKPPYIEVYRRLIQEHILDCFDLATTGVHSQEALLIHTSYEIKIKLKDLIQKYLEAFGSLLKKAEENKEIQPYYDSKELAKFVYLSLMGFYPPYDMRYSPNHRKDLNKEGLKDLLSRDAAILMDIIISGLKTVKYDKKLFNNTSHHLSFKDINYIKRSKYD